MEIGSLYVDRLVRRSPQSAHCALVVVSERMLEKVKTCEIRSEIYGASDHCPIVLEIDDTFEGTDDVKVTDTVGTTDTIEAPGPSAA
jgi:vacuolar-type H+-ATPase subunit F/Vma7